MYACLRKGKGFNLDHIFESTALVACINEALVFFKRYVIICVTGSCIAQAPTPCVDAVETEDVADF